jgi:hypothetical protein
MSVTYEPGASFETRAPPRPAELRTFRLVDTVVTTPAADVTLVALTLITAAEPVKSAADIKTAAAVLRNLFSNIICCSPIWTRDDAQLFHKPEKE